jgi:hypothetical protein
LKKYLLLCVFFLLTFLFSSCGGGGSSFSSPAVEELEEEFRIEKVMPSTSPEYFQWLSTFPEEVKEFPEWRNSQEAKNWNFTYWTSEFPYDLHEYDSGENIYNSKLINCHRGTVLLLQKYPGNYIYIDQEGDKDHAVFQGIDSAGPFYISFCGVECGFYRTITEIYERK